MGTDGNIMPNVNDVNSLLAHECGEMLGLSHQERNVLVADLDEECNGDCLDDRHRRGYCFISRAGRFQGWIDKLSMNRPGKGLRFECSFWSDDQTEHHRWVVFM